MQWPSYGSNDLAFRVVSKLYDDASNPGCKQIAVFVVVDEMFWCAYWIDFFVNIANLELANLVLALTS
jgi:hypothetical protein